MYTRHQLLVGTNQTSDRCVDKNITILIKKSNDTILFPRSMKKLIKFTHLQNTYSLIDIYIYKYIQFVGDNLLYILKIYVLFTAIEIRSIIELAYVTLSKARIIVERNLREINRIKTYHWNNTKIVTARAIRLRN